MTIDTKISGRSVKKSLTFGLLLFLSIIIFVYFFGVGEGVTPLMRAADSGQVQRLTELIKKGVDLDEKSMYNWTALIFASSAGNEDAVIILLDAGANPNIKSKAIPSSFSTTGDYPPTTALQESIRKKHFNISNILIDRGVRIDPASVALAGAIQNIEILEKLERKGVDFNILSENAFYPFALAVAANEGHVNIVKWLIKNGANPNLETSRKTALSVAMYSHNFHKYEVIKYLLKSGADPDFILNKGRHTEETVFFRAIQNYVSMGGSNYIEIIKMMLENGANKDFRQHAGRYTALEYLKNYEDEESFILRDRSKEVIEQRLKNRAFIVTLLEEY